MLLQSCNATGVDMIESPSENDIGRKACFACEPFAKAVSKSIIQKSSLYAG